MSGETNFPAKYASPEKDTRVPDPDANSRGPRSDFAAPGERQSPPVGVAPARTQRASQGRLTSPPEFRYVLRGGRSKGAGGLVVHVREREGGGEPRLGLVVPRAVGTAVERNRLKRQIRAAWRAIRSDVSSVDCVVAVRPRAVGTVFRDLSGHLEGCLRALGALRAPARAGAVS